MSTKRYFKSPDISIFCNHGNISIMHFLRSQGLMTILLINSNNALAIRIIEYITLSELSPENFIKVFFVCVYNWYDLQIFINIS